MTDLDSRSGQSDFAATDSKAFMDGMKQYSVRRAKRELFTPDLGWWGYLPYTLSYSATTPDEDSSEPAAARLACDFVHGGS